MELEHSFTVPVSKERAWDVLLDVERVAPCMPGATLDSVDGDVINGRIKVKVGPISMTYTGKAEIVEKDEAAGVIRMDASGKETKGAGTASASVRSQLEGQGNETRVTVHTTMNVTGKPAQFGRGVMNEVSGKLIGIFADNLAEMLAESDGGQVPVAPSADLPIDDLHLSTRAVAVLRKDGINTASLLAARTADELIALDGIGPASLDEIKAKLAEHGLTLSAPPAAPAASTPAASTPAASAPVPASTSAAAPAAAPAAAATPAAATPAAATATPTEKAATNGSTRPAGTPVASNGHGATTGSTATSAPRRRPVRRKDDSLNLLRVAGVPVLKRSIPVLSRRHGRHHPQLAPPPPPPQVAPPPESSPRLRK